MTLDPDGNVLLDSQADSELLLVRNPERPSQTVIQVPLSSPLGTPQLDDTFSSPIPKASFWWRTLTNIVYAIHKRSSLPGRRFRPLWQERQASWAS